MAIEYTTPKKAGDVISALNQSIYKGKAEAKEKTPVEAPEKRKRGEAKQLLTLRLDKDVVEAFKVTGAGWQSKINDALRGVLKLVDKK